LVLDSSFDHDRAKRKARPAAVLALAGLLLGGCAATSVVNGLTPEDDFRLVADIRYGPEPRQALDIYLPTRTPLRRTPLVFVYGGAWERGDKADYLFVGQAFAELGYATVVPDYRLYPDASFPDFVDDVAAAVTTALGRLGKAACLDARRVVLVGHSAGAHTAALLALDPDYLARAGAIEPAALVGLAGPYDLPLDDPLVVGKFD
jgi:acetyl esterase/lipase